MPHLARHLLAEYYGCKPDLLDDPDAVHELIVSAAQAAGSAVVGAKLHKFEPQGVTGLLVLAESHLALHTWPEHDFVTAEIFACGERADVHAGHRLLLEVLRPRESDVRVIGRGEISRIDHPEAIRESEPAR